MRFETTEPWTFFEERRPNKNKMSSDMGSVPDPKNTEVPVYKQDWNNSLHVKYYRKHSKSLNRPIHQQRC